MTDDRTPDTITTPDQLDALELDEDLALIDQGHTVDYDDETETTGECVDDCPGCALARVREYIARGSADAETLRAEVERLRGEMDRYRRVSIAADDDLTEASRGLANAHAAIESLRAERDAARTEAATLRTAIEAKAAEYEANGQQRVEVGKPAWPLNVARDLRALAAHPAPEAGHDEECGDYPAPCNCDDPSTHDTPKAAPPTLTVTREQVDAARDAANAAPHAGYAPVGWPVTFLARLGVTVVDAPEVDRGATDLGHLIFGEVNRG